jgi:hypothetical protein
MPGPGSAELHDPGLVCQGPGGYDSGENNHAE